MSCQEKHPHCLFVAGLHPGENPCVSQTDYRLEMLYFIRSLHAGKVYPALEMKDCGWQQQQNLLERLQVQVLGPRLVDASAEVSRFLLPCVLWLHPANQRLSMLVSSNRSDLWS